MTGIHQLNNNKGVTVATAARPEMVEQVNHLYTEGISYRIATNTEVIYFVSGMKFACCIVKK